MRKSSSGIGFVLLIVTLAIVLLLVAKSWEKTGPTAMQISDPDAPVGVEDHGESEAGEALQRGALPDLNDMRAGTSAHAERLQEVLAETE